MSDAPERPTTAPDDQDARKRRLRDLMELARTYRGWSLRELADELGRDVHNLIPGSGIPKLDLVRGLAEILEWSVQDVSDDIHGGDSDVTIERAAPAAWADIDREAYQAHCDGRWADLIKLGMLGVRTATSGDERARSWMRVGAGWEGKGRFTKAMHAVRSALRERDRSSEITMKLRNNLAQLHYLLGEFEEAYGIATAAIEAIRNRRVTGRFLDGSLGFASFVRGNCSRVFAGIDHADRLVDAGLAIDDLSAAVPLLHAGYRESQSSAFRVAAMIAEGGIIEMRVLLGQTGVDEGMEQLIARMDDVVDPGRLEPQSLLEAYGWWCIFAANVALRHVEEPGRLELLMSILTNKADEIAERTSNWSLRERVWTLELVRREQLRRVGDPCADTWTIDDDDVRTIAGAMARFPTFRETGWQVLRSVRVLGGQEG